jgi:hypothetical protein
MNSLNVNYFIGVLEDVISQFIPLRFATLELQLEVRVIDVEVLCCINIHALMKLLYCSFEVIEAPCVDVISTEAVLVAIRLKLFGLDALIDDLSLQDGIFGGSLVIHFYLIKYSIFNKFTIWFELCPRTPSSGGRRS